MKSEEGRAKSVFPESILKLIPGVLSSFLGPVSKTLNCHIGSVLLAE